MKNRHTIKKLVSKTVKKDSLGDQFTLYTYRVSDTAGEDQIIKDKREFYVGEPVHVIWTKLSDTYNQPYLMRYCTHCEKPVKEKALINHEFCKHQRV